MDNGIKRCVAECYIGSLLRRSLVNLLFYASRRAKSKLEDECNKQVFERDEQVAISIASSFLWSQHAIVYRSPWRDASLRRCRASRMSCLGGIAVPPGSGLQRAKRFMVSFTTSCSFAHLPSSPHLFILVCHETRRLRRDSGRMGLAKHFCTLGMFLEVSLTK
jgi:hypothetical protein